MVVDSKHRRSPITLRVHLSTGHTYQPDSPMGLDIKLLERALKEPPKDPLRMVPERLSFRASSGAVSPALGPAPQGCPVDRGTSTLGNTRCGAQRGPPHLKIPDTQRLGLFRLEHPLKATVQGHRTQAFQGP